MNGSTQVHDGCSVKGANLSFRILGGEYRITVKGDGISLSARGSGVATLLGVPGVTGLDAGIYSTDLEADCQDAPEQCDPMPLTLRGYRSARTR